MERARTLCCGGGCLGSLNGSLERWTATYYSLSTSVGAHLDAAPLLLPTTELLLPWVVGSKVFLHRVARRASSDAWWRWRAKNAAMLERTERERESNGECVLFRVCSAKTDVCLIY